MSAEPAKNKSPVVEATTENQEIPATIENQETPVVAVVDEIPRIQRLSEEFVKSYPGKRSCFVLGATGATGCRISRDLINSGAFETIKLIVRRAMPEELVPTPPAGVRIEQVIIQDFANATEEVFSGCEFGFCALGTTKKNAGDDTEFFRIDHDLTLNLLKLAKAAGCKYLALISASGAAASSIFLYQKTKGKLENDVIELNFDALRIYRPAMIQVRRKEERIWEEIALIIAPILDICTLGRAAVKVDRLADSMVKDALIYGTSGNLTAEKRLVFISNKDIKSTR